MLIQSVIKIFLVLQQAHPLKFTVLWLNPLPKDKMGTTPTEIKKLISPADSSYPLQKKGHSLEFFKDYKPFAGSLKLVWCYI